MQKNRLLALRERRSLTWGMDLAQLFPHRPVALLATVLCLAATTLSAQLPETLAPEAIQHSLVNLGDTARLQQALAKARRGEKVVVASIGGSITEGARATTRPNRYPEVIGEWWRKTFPKAQIEVINAGIGATGSNFGAMRFQRDVLSKHPDVIVVEFAVNDGNSEASAQTYEGLLRQALNHPDKPAVVLLFMLRKDGSNAQEWFSKVGTHYDLPMVSYRDAVWPEIQAGKMKWEDISPDTVHPNDLGHGYTAQTVNALFAKVLETLPADDKLAVAKPVPAPLLTDVYERTSLFTGEELKPVANQGWTYEAPASAKMRGWKSAQPGSTLEFDVQGTIIFLQYWRINGPMGKANVTVDGATPTVQDAWFDQTWGGFNVTQLVAKDLKPGTHRVRVELLEDKNPKSTGNEFRVTGIGSAGM